MTLLPAVLAGLAVAVLLARTPDPRLLDALGRAGTTVPRVRVPRLPEVPPAVLAALGGLGGLLLSGPALGAVGAVGAVLVVRVVAARTAAAAVTAERAGALEACAVLASELRSGRTPGAALQGAAEVAAGPLQERLAAASAATGFGGDPATALLTGRPTAVPQVVAGLAACWQVCSGTGSGLAAAVDRLEEGLRHEAAARRAVEAELAGPRATAGMLALLPLGGIALAATLGARPLHVLLETTVGAVCLVAGVALDLAGLAWTRRLAASASRV